MNEELVTHAAVMKVTTLFGHSSSGGGGGTMHESGGGGGLDTVIKGHSNVDDINHNEFVPVVCSPTPTGGGSIMPGAPPAVERASSEVLYSSITTRYENYFTLQYYQ